MLKIPIDIFAHDFVMQIDKFQPCDIYHSYLLYGRLRLGMSLRDIINSKHICLSDKIWLLELLYENLEHSKSAMIFYDGECRLRDKWIKCTLSDHVDFLEDTYYDLEEN